MIILNDIWAYVFGFFFGRTPLIQVSPKKTWEGFIGGGVATVICGIVVSSFLLYTCMNKIIFFVFIKLYTKQSLKLFFNLLYFV